MNNKPLISIIIPAFNAKNTIEKCLNSLRNLKYENREIIIIDDGSKDSTCEFLREQNDIILIETENQGPSRARNLGILIAKGEYIAFTDSDCIVHQDWLDELYTGFEKAISLLSSINEKSQIAAVGGNQLSPIDDTNFGKKVQHFLKKIGVVADYIKKDNVKNIYEVKHNPTCNVLYRKSALIDAGFFNEHLWPGEDLEIDYILKKRGYKFFYNPKAIVYHYRPAKNSNFVKMLFHYGRAQGVLVRKYGMFRLLHFLALSFSVIFVLMLIFPHSLIFIINILLLIFAAAFIGSFFTGKDIKSGIRLFLMLIESVISWFLGFYYGFIANKGLPSKLSPPKYTLFEEPILQKFPFIMSQYKMPTPLVSILFPNWNGRDDTLKTLDSIIALNYPKNKLEIIITDNGSTDWSQKAIKEKFSKMKMLGYSNLILIENSKNEGATQAYNQAYAKADMKREFVLKLDNDVELEPETLNNLLNVFKEDLRTGIAGGEIRSTFDRRVVVHSAGYTFFPLALFPSIKKNKRVECCYVTGCCALIKQDVLNKIGSFLDNNYFVYHDDVDLCLNARKFVYNIIYEPNAIIYHKVGRSTGRPKGSPFAMYYDFRNKFYLVSKHASLSSKILFYFTLPVNLIYFYYRYRVFSPMIIGLKDYIVGNMGRGSFKKNG